MVQIAKRIKLNKKIRISVLIPHRAKVVTIGFGDLHTKIELQINQTVNTMLVCIDSRQKKFCSGDSGEPLFLLSNKQQVGVISATYRT